MKQRNEQRGSLIAIVEDNEDNRELLHKILDFKGYDSIMVKNGREFRALLHRTNVDLVLLDLRLPDVEGLELISSLRAEGKLQTTPIVAITASTAPGDQEQAMRVGCAQYITKPYDLHHLLQLIDDLLSNKG